MHTIRGEYNEAVKYFNQAGTIFKVLKMSHHYLEVKHNIGVIQLRIEKYKSALEKFLSCIKIGESEQYQPILGIAYSGASEAYFRVGNIKLEELPLKKAIVHC